VPIHILSVIKNEKRQVDEFEDLTLLYTDMVGFTSFSRNVKDPREVVSLLSKLFTRFDQLCDENKVYKVHTIGDCYVVMGYNGKIDKLKRVRAIVIDEANRVIQTGLEMIDIIREVASAAEDQSQKDLAMRIGVHTGRVVAGIIGSKVVRYDIFGEGVLIANKMESNGIPGKVCVSEDTKRYLMQQPDVYADYQFDEHKTLHLPTISKEIKSYAISRRERDSIESGMLSSEARRGLNKLSDSAEGEEEGEAGSSGDGGDNELPAHTERGFATSRPLLNAELEMAKLDGAMADRVAE
jgi:class 3 adenylate cyclase